LEITLEQLLGADKLNFFGVRHFSPTVSYHLERFLEKTDPDIILIECAADATPQIMNIAAENVKPPIAVLCFTTDLPVESVLYPFASYSPEYRAVLYGINRKKTVKFIDLPAEISVSFKNRPANKDHIKFENEIYKKIAEINGCENYDDYFERNFEYCTDDEYYRERLETHSSELRGIFEASEYEESPVSAAFNQLRESYMRTQIKMEIESGTPPEKIAVICGAYHLFGLKNSTETLSEKQIAALPRRDIKTTLMPYSFLRLASFTGYGAGNRAPAYFELVHKFISAPEEIPYHYASMLGECIRDNKGYASTADIIETVRLAKTLAALSDKPFPTLSDLEEAAVACLSKGERAKLALPFASMNVGTKFGFVPKGLTSTSIQDDMERELNRLKLQKYKSTIANSLTLDLRQNTARTSDEAQYLDLNRSTFLHRLIFLNIGFAQKQNISQTGASWKEVWNLQWSPESEIRLIENVLRGETIELAAAFYLGELLEAATDPSEAAALTETAYICKLTEAIPSALSKLQYLFTDCDDFKKLAKTAGKIAGIVNFGDIRRTDTTNIESLLREIMLSCMLSLIGSSSCDDNAAAEIIIGMETVERIALTMTEYCDTSRWEKTLFEAAQKDNINAGISGAAFAILLEKGKLTTDYIKTQISRRLSAGVPGDIAAAWIFGVSSRNHYVLLSRPIIWEALNDYIAALSEDEFLKTLVFLRRVFSDYNTKEIEGIAELLSAIYSVSSDETAIYLTEDLSDDENAAIDALSDFDF
jgi:hypothetical protein